MPKNRRPSAAARRQVVPDPTKGSTTRSPGLSVLPISARFTHFFQESAMHASSESSLRRRCGFLPQPIHGRDGFACLVKRDVRLEFVKATRAGLGVGVR